MKIEIYRIINDAAESVAKWKNDPPYKNRKLDEDLLESIIDSIVGEAVEEIIKLKGK